MIYEPREDSFLIQKWIKKYALGRVLDIGTGSGVLALEAMRYSNDVLAIDINLKAVAAAKKKGINAKISDLFSDVEGKFDLIIFNPPYLPEDPREDEESKIATTGGKEGHEIVERFLASAGEHLNEKGRILLLFSSLTGDVPKIAEKYGFNCDIIDEQPLFFEKLKVCVLTKKNI